MTTKTREAWLGQAVTKMHPWFRAQDVELPAVRVSIGWPGGRGNKQGVIGQCWGSAAVKDGRPAIFISPALSEDDPARILDVLVHELVHAAGHHGHRSGFARLARSLGLVAPWTATSASSDLSDRLVKMAAKLGPFGHASVNAGQGLAGSGPARPPVQSTRMLKLSCEECGYTLRTTSKWIAVGIPSCPNESCIYHGIQLDIEQKKEAT